MKYFKYFDTIIFNTINKVQELTYNNKNVHQKLSYVQSITFILLYTV